MTKSIVLEVCRQYGITPEEFFGPRRKGRLSEARRAAVEAFLAAGFSQAGAARMIRRNYTTVQYWVHERYREKASKYYREYHARRAA